MASFNNFDQSSTGINIQMNLFRDEDGARDLFNESFRKIDKAPHSKFEFLEFTLDQDRPAFSFSDPDQYKFTRAELNKAIRSEPGLVDDLRSVLGRSPFSSSIGKSELFAALVEAMPAGDLAGFLAGNFTTLYQQIAVYGYSQGDYVVVIYSKETVEELTAGDLASWSDKESARRDDCQNLIFNQPVYGRIEAGDIEIYIDDLMVDPYDYDKDQIIESFETKHRDLVCFGSVLNFLQASLPAYI
jgi:hypothetical protein